MRERIEEVMDQLQRTSEDLDVTIRLTRVNVFHFYGLGFNRVLSFDVFHGRRRGGSLRCPGRRERSRFLLPFFVDGGGEMAAKEGEGGSGSFFGALDWRMNIASMPSLRFCTGLMNVGDSVPTLPTP
jgi:hypothetical protein